MERELLLLGLLRQHEMYGYQINDLINLHLRTSVELTKPTAYRLLHNMAERGWITYRDEKVGKRPTRRIYAVTEDGESQFQKMLVNCLGEYEPMTHPSTVCMAFSDILPPEEVILLLKRRLETIKERIEVLISDQSHLGTFKYVIDYQIRHLETDLAWYSDVISQLESMGKMV